VATLYGHLDPELEDMPAQERGQRLGEQILERFE